MQRWRSRPKRQTANPVISDEKIAAQLFSRCSNKCLHDHFMLETGRADLNSLVGYIRTGRETVLNMTTTTSTEVLFRLFKGTIKNRLDCIQKTTKLDHNWVLPDMDSNNCRHCWGLYYGFSKHAMNLCASSLKGNVTFIGTVTESYEDTEVFEYTYDETREMLINETIDENGKSVEWAGRYIHTGTIFMFLCSITATVVCYL